MSAQELRISRAEALLSQMVENQTATLRLLNAHSTQLDEHAAQLKRLERLLGTVVDELVEIKELLAAPRGMGFAPERAETA